MEELALASENTIFIVYYYEYNFSKLLKAFYHKEDAIAYQKHYQLINYNKAYIEEIVLE